MLLDENGLMVGDGVMSRSSISFRSVGFQMNSLLFQTKGNFLNAKCEVTRSFC